MFTGIIEALGHIDAVEARGGDVRLAIRTGSLNIADVQLGDSIAVNGVCLTANELSDTGFVADVSVETLNATTIGDLAAGGEVNLERALAAGDRLGGHIVSGHVDGVGEVIERVDDARSVRFRLRVPAPLARYVARKGSITVDGTSLTVNGVRGAEFDVNIVPHTLEHTIIGGYAPGTRVNIEVDLVARYLERLLQGDAAAEDE